MPFYLHNNSQCWKDLRHSQNLARIWRDSARDALAAAAEDLAESVDDVVRARDALEEAETDLVIAARNTSAYLQLQMLMIQVDEAPPDTTTKPHPYLLTPPKRWISY